MADALQTLQLKIHTDTKTAGENIDKLIVSLEKLKSACGNSSELKEFAENLKSIASSLSSLGRVKNLNKVINSVNGIAKANNAAASAAKRAKESMDGMPNATEAAEGFIDVVDEETEAEKDNTNAVRQRILALSRMSRRQRDLEKSTSKLGNILGGLTKKFKKFFSQIKRIAMYRMIRSALRAITQGFSEGVKAMYMWSQQTGENKFVETMDRLATATFYLRNGFASMFRPLIDYGVPILDNFIDKLVDFFNSIQQGIARLTGASGWTKALKVQRKYGDELDDTAKKAKKMHELMNFDELNVINTNDSSGKDDVEDYSSMFEWVENVSASNVFAPILKVLEEVKRGFTNAFVADTDALAENSNRIIESVERTFSDERVQKALDEFSTSASETIGAIPGAVASIATSFSVGVTGGVADALESLEEFNSVNFASIIESATTISESFKDVAETTSIVAKTFEGGGFQKIVEVVTKIADVTVVALGEKVVGFLGDVAKYFTKPYRDNADKFREIFDQINDIFAKLLSPLSSITDKLAANAKQYKDSKIHQFFEDITAWKSQKMGDVLTKIRDGLQWVNEKLSTLAQKPNSLKAKFGEAFDYLFTKVTNTKDKVVKKIEELVNKVKGLFNFNLSFPSIKLPHIRITQKPVENAVAKFLGINTIPSISVDWYAKGGFVNQGTLFGAGEVPGQAEMVGNINGRTGVVSGAEISGIREAIVESGEREEALLRSLLSELHSKNLTIAPSAALGRVNAQSARMYGMVSG